MNKIKPGSVVGILYSVESDGEVIEKTEGIPIEYMHGAEMLLPALEDILNGKKIGDEFDETVPPENAYGVRDETNVITLDKWLFPPHLDLEPGARLAAKTTGGDTHPMTVLEVIGDRVRVDLNHPLAGKALRFKGTIVSIRSGEGFLFSAGRPVEQV